MHRYSSRLPIKGFSIARIASAAVRSRAGATLAAWLVLAGMQGGCAKSPAENLASAEASLAAGDLGAAAIYVGKALQSDDIGAEAQILRGRIALLAGDFPRARQAFDSAVELGATDARTARLLAETLISGGDVDAALEALERIEVADRDMEYWLLRARALLQQGATAEASAALAQSFVVGGESSRVLVVQSRLAELEQRGADGAQLLDRAVAGADSWHDRAEALMARAAFNTRAQRLAEAGDDLQAAVDIYREAGAARKSLDAQLALIEVLLTLGDLDAARQAASQLAAMAPNAPLASYAEGAVAYRQRRYDDAIAKLELAVNGAPDNLQFQTLLGAAHLAAGNSNQGMQQLSDVLRRSPGDPSATKLLARLRLQQRRPDDALRLLRAVPADRVDTEVEMLLAAASLTNGDAKTAVESAEHAAARNPEDQSLQLELARMYLAVGRDDAALPILNMLSAGDDALRAATLAMFARLRAGELEAAQAISAELVARFPAEPRAYMAAALLAQTIGDAATTNRRLEEAIHAEPSYLPARLALAAALEAAGRLPDAAEQFRQVLAIDANDTSALAGLARLAIVRGDLGEAESYLGRAAATARNSERIRFALGQVKTRRGELDAALAIAASLEKDFPDAPEAALLAAQVRMVQGRYRDAARSFEAALSRSRTWPVLAQLVRASELAGQVDEAVFHLRAWLAQRADHTEARLVLAQLLQNAGRDAEASAEYERVIEHDPRNVAALNNAAWLLRERELPRALELAERAVELASDNPAVLDTHGWLLVAAGRADEGIVSLQKAAELAPASEDIRDHLAYAVTKSRK